MLLRGRLQRGGAEVTGAQAVPRQGLSAASLSRRPSLVPRIRRCRLYSHTLGISQDEPLTAACTLAPSCGRSRLKRHQDSQRHPTSYLDRYRHPHIGRYIELKTQVNDDQHPAIFVSLSSISRGSRGPGQLLIILIFLWGINLSMLKCTTLN